MLHGLAASWLGAPLTAALGGVLVVIVTLAVAGPVRAFRNYTVDVADAASRG